ncbi:copper amine oxidase N-terminal domain-containing protein [Paenibacillus sedimenti]|uniref:Copper amine oxidase N-terminal domain-containing protein n=1 Tax=Paenibacillus sedimenti TaxID=2770274 RepID=A0A926QLJ6_9BACL|nr:copper amine oxidase N-terminal domain-containing protein [Paenibacillus sedimenti]MBD0383695.1 copper amine oxidase N-terminal domain-containing protein [Paenibacillus sedimenti]
MKISMFKKPLSLLFSLLLLFTFAVQTTFAAQTNVKVMLDGKQLQFEDAKPVIVDGSTLVPFRKLFETLGFQVKWEDSGDVQHAIGTKDGLVIDLTINGTSATVNGSAVSLEVPAQIIDGSTMVPLRFVAENSGKEVTFASESDAFVIYIGKNEAACNPPSGGDFTAYMNMMKAFEEVKSYSFQGTMNMKTSDSDTAMKMEGDVNLQPEFAQHIKSSMQMAEMNLDQEIIMIKNKVYFKDATTGAWTAMDIPSDTMSEEILSQYFTCEMLAAIKDIKVDPKGNELMVDVNFDPQKYDQIVLNNSSSSKTVALKQQYVIDAKTNLPKSVVFTMDSEDENGALSMQAEYSYTFGPVKQILPPAGVN